MRFIATIVREGNATLAEFPDCHGCQAFVVKGDGQAIEEKASEALHGWLETTLSAGDEIPSPSAHVSMPRGARALAVDVSPTLAIKIALRLQRQRAHLTQADVAERAGITQQAVARIESPGSCPSIKTLERVARALGTRLEMHLRPEEKP